MLSIVDLGINRDQNLNVAADGDGDTPKRKVLLMGIRDLTFDPHHMQVGRSMEPTCMGGGRPGGLHAIAVMAVGTWPIDV
jgi:hypothetical protein